MLRSPLGVPLPPPILWTPNQHLLSPLAFPGRAPYSPRPPEKGGLPGPGSSSCRPSPQRRRQARLAPTCSPASWWRQHLAMLLQLPRARASLIALASLPRCQSPVTVLGHREPKSGGVCSWRACECGPKRACVRARVCVSSSESKEGSGISRHPNWNPLKVGGRWRAGASFLSSSRFSQVKVIKRFVYWGNAEVPQPSPAPTVASGPRRMRAVRSAPHNARIKAVLQQLPLLLHL